MQAPNNIDIGIGNCIDIGTGTDTCIGIGIGTCIGIGSCICICSGNCIGICTGTWLGRGVVLCIEWVGATPARLQDRKIPTGVSGVILREMELPQDCKTARFLHESQE